MYKKIEFERFLIKLIGSFKVIPDINEYMQKYTAEQISAGNIEKMTLMLNFLELNEDNIPLFVKVGNIATLSDKYKEIKKIIDFKTSFNSYSGEAGVVPQVFKNKLEMLEKMSKESEAGKFRNLIISLIDERKKGIKEHKNLTEEFKHR